MEAKEIQRKTGVVLLNMGGPNDLHEVQVFLRNMFNDPNILTFKSAMLRRIVASIITANRTKAAQENYRHLGGKSPIVGLTRRLVAALQSALGEGNAVAFAMRYTPPYAAEAIAQLREAGVTHLLLLPLYPHYSTTTTKSSLEDFEAQMHLAGFEAVTTEIKHFFEAPSYNDVLVERIFEAVSPAEAGEFDLIFSAHGLPQKIVDNGDPYAFHVREHIRLLEAMLQARGVRFGSVCLAYQSRVGPMQWLEPALDETLKGMKGKNVLVFPLSFTIDNSETLYELDIEYRELAEAVGVKTYRVAACPNDHPLFVAALVRMIAHALTRV